MPSRKDRETPPRRLFDRNDVAAILDVSPNYLQNLTDRGILAKPVKAAGPKWTENDIERAIRNLELERKEEEDHENLGSTGSQGVTGRHRASQTDADRK